MFVAVYSGTHVVGGSSLGCKFLRESGSYIPSSFLGYVSTNSGTYMYIRVWWHYNFMIHESYMYIACVCSANFYGLFWKQ